MSEDNQHGSPSSFYASPHAALKAPPEEFLYLACLHEGTGVDAPDFIAVVDAEDGRIVHETPMPNVGDELHHFGWNRCSSACHGPDRSHLIVPGFRSSRIHILNVADDPRRPRIEKVIEPRRARREDRLHAPAHRPLHAGREHRRSACSATPTATVPAGSRCWTRARSRSRAAGRTAARRPPLELRLLVSAAQERARLVGVGRAERLRVRLRHRRRRRGPLRAAGCTSGISPSGGSCRRSTSASRAGPARGALPARPRGRAGLRRR